ncbi:SEC-C domain-containing protein [bacterium]|nr:SEC-C domain-containing protein [bacterium]
MSTTKVGRNEICPCGSGKKYKHCCENKVDWNGIFSTGADWIPYLSIRGRNINFLNRLADILQIRNLTNDLSTYKAAFTANAVEEIHEAVMEFWPPDLDIVKALESASSEVSGLYVGDYEPEYFIKGIIRHSLYANKILVVDPFIYPSSVRDQYNPILEPEQYRSQTLKDVNLWFSLIPWIEDGIVEVIRTPADFDRRLNWESMERQIKKFADNPELHKAMKRTVQELKCRHGEKMARTELVLMAPDSVLRKRFEENELEKRGLTADDFLLYVQNQRDNDPNFLEPLGQNSDNGQMFALKSGSNYEIAKLTASITNSYLVTDLFARWREIELDRDSQSTETRIWSPFAKAIQNNKLSYLNSVDLKHALLLRKEGRLESMRMFLRKVWKSACTGEEYDDKNTQLLTEELYEEINKAQEEWNQIDADLLKMIKGDAVTSLLAAGPLVASGHGDFLAAAIAVAGTYDFLTVQTKRRSFPKRFPAAFFMNIDK